MGCCLVDRGGSQKRGKREKAMENSTMASGLRGCAPLRSAPRGGLGGGGGCRGRWCAKEGRGKVAAMMGVVWSAVCWDWGED